MRPQKMCAGGARDIAYAGRWTQGGRTVGNANAIGRAGHPHPSHPGNPATAGRRGRRPLRVADKRRYQHSGKQMRKCNHLRPSLGSPERGAVAARSAVTEGLVQRRCGAITSPVNQSRAGVEARPYGVWGRWVREIQRYPSTDGGVGAEVGCAQNRRRRSSDGGAPRTVRPTTCGKVSA